MSAVLSLVAVTFNAWLSPASALIPLRLTICNPASSLTAAGFEGWFKVGGAFDRMTVRTKVSDALNPPWSVTVTVIVEEPDAFVTGVTKTVRLPLVPEKVTSAGRTTAGLLESPASVRKVAGVSASPMVKSIAILALVVLSVMSEIVGGEFTVRTAGGLLCVLPAGLLTTTV